MSQALDNFRQMLDITYDCPQLGYLYILPNIERVEEHMKWSYHRRHYFLFKLFDEQYPNKIEVHNWEKIRVGCSLVFEAFSSEFSNMLEELTVHKQSRIAYLKRIFDKVYHGPARFNSQKEKIDFLISSKFKGLKPQIGDELWNELDEIGYALSQSALYGYAFDHRLEREFQIEDEPLSFGYYYENDTASRQEQTDSNGTSHEEKQTESAPNETYNDDLDNDFNNMKLGMVKEWFMLATKRRNKQKHYFLSERDVEQFVMQAFVHRNLRAEKITANIGKGSFWTFARLFSDYYLHCTGGNRPIDERPAIRDEYIKLLTDHFEGFDFAKVKKNFGKKVGEAWKLR